MYFLSLRGRFLVPGSGVGHGSYSHFETFKSKIDAGPKKLAFFVATFEPIMPNLIHSVTYGGHMSRFVIFSYKFPEQYYLHQGRIGTSSGPTGTS